MEDLLNKLENRVKQALERIDELESENKLLQEENESLAEENHRLKEELEQRNGEVTEMGELRARLEAAETKQELARHRIESIIALLDTILEQHEEETPVLEEHEPASTDEEEQVVPPGIALPIEEEEEEVENDELGDEEVSEANGDTFPLLNFHEEVESSPDTIEEEPPGEPPLDEESDSPTVEPPEPSGPKPLGIDSLIVEEEKDNTDQDPFGGSF